MGRGLTSYEMQVFTSLEAKSPESVVGVRNSHLVADLTSYERTSFAEGHCQAVWRQGVKHDVAKTVELTRDSTGSLYNGYGERVEVEGDRLFPLVKGSDLFNNKDPLKTSRWLIVTQKELGEDTNHLRNTSPALWQYLKEHSGDFQLRKSSIYKGRSPYAMFGIGSYTFSPFKVAVSGLHKRPVFRTLGPIEGRPVVLDDTCYFIPSYMADEAGLIAALLNSSLCKDFIQSVCFWDSKRPLTKRLLQRIDLKAIASRLDLPELAIQVEQLVESMGRALKEGSKLGGLREIGEVLARLDHLNVRDKEPSYQNSLF